MRLRASTFVIPEKEGSDPSIERGPNPFKYDKLGRKASAESLTRTLSATPGPLVCAVDGGWGAGKTTFLKMWCQHLKNERFSTLYFSAWENDFADDALISLIGELDAAMDGFGLKGDAFSGAKGLWSKVKNLAPSVCRVGIPAAIGAAPSVLLDGGATVIAATTGAVVRDQMEHYGSAKKNFGEFKKQMKGFAKAVSGEAEDGSHKPLVVFIDELDRCRPSYAIQVLERIKHLFDVPNMVFVMAMNKAEMAHSVKAVYGEGMDAEGYLRRFFDLEFLLPPPANDKFLDSLFDRFELDNWFKKRDDRDQFFNVFKALFSCFDMTPRDQEQCFGQLVAVLMSVSPETLIFPVPLGALLVIKQKKAAYYQQIIGGDVDLIEVKQTNANSNAKSNVMRYIRNTTGGEAFYQEHSGRVLEAYLVMCSPDKHRQQLIDEYQARVARESNDEEVERCQKVLHIVEGIDKQNRYLKTPFSLPYMIGLIEQAPKFTVG